MADSVSDKEHELEKQGARACLCESPCPCLFFFSSTGGMFLIQYMSLMADWRCFSGLCLGCLEETSRDFESGTALLQINMSRIIVETYRVLSSHMNGDGEQNVDGEAQATQLCTMEH